MNFRPQQAQFDGLESVIRAAQVRAELDIRERFNHAQCESYIERLFLAALYAATAYRPHINGPTRVLPTALGTTGPEAGSPTDGLYIALQVQYGPRRADFVVWAHDGKKWKPLVVECDGHDFHERTKEQAAKDRDFDRYVQRGGATIFRFTGHQIVNKPDSCAYEVLRWADQQIVGGPHG